ncbi:hypothetical protein PoB_002282000 [Plakobranchus ocellatus]|uniref:Uncharacterized protein n=1 Tax=Plakobranchus ocellatus TaxID=259542 RepID=A0AAV3ZMF4_9GAST|nr:hypothetical protein PoB_002282000 [Plakobranchus ocellatus]
MKILGFCILPVHKADLRLSGPPSGQGAGDEARTPYRRVPVDLRADSLAIMPTTPPRRMKREPVRSNSDSQLAGPHGQSSLMTRVRVGGADFYLKAPRKTYEARGTIFGDSSVLHAANFTM